MLPHAGKSLLYESFFYFFLLIFLLTLFCFVFFKKEHIDQANRLNLCKFVVAQLHEHLSKGKFTKGCLLYCMVSDNPKIKSTNPANIFCCGPATFCLFFVSVSVPKNQATMVFLKIWQLVCIYLTTNLYIFDNYAYFESGNQLLTDLCLFCIICCIHSYGILMLWIAMAWSLSYPTPRTRLMHGPRHMSMLSLRWTCWSMIHPVLATFRFFFCLLSHL